MDIKEYISSGILELYVIGTLSEEERLQVEHMAEKHMEVRREIFEISKNLEQYARSQGLKPDAMLEEKLFSNLPPKEKVLTEPPMNQRNSGKENPGWKWLTILFSIIAISSVFTLYRQNKRFETELNEVNKSILNCDSLIRKESEKSRIYAQMVRPDTKVYELISTEKFPDAKLKLYYNTATKTNTLQWLNAPSLDPGMVYQLWYFDNEGVPKPLETFDAKKSLWEITFQEGASTYAFTIEPEGGSETPTITNLIGTVGI